jgi:hypothetical protein
MLRNKSVFFSIADKHIKENSLEQKQGGFYITDKIIKVISYNSSYEYSWNYFSHKK